MAALARALDESLALENRYVMGLDRSTCLTERGCEVVVGFWARGELLEDECPGFLAPQHVHALVAREPSFELRALLRMQRVNAEVLEALKVSPAIDRKLSACRHVFA